MKIYILLIFIIFSYSCFAGGDRVENGGDIDEENIIVANELLENTSNKIFRFFSQNSELEAIFPEFQRQELLSLRGRIQFTIQNFVLSCNHRLHQQTYSINCPITLINQYRHNAKDFFVFVFHELLKILGKENDQQQDYPISSRLARYVQRINSFDLIYTSQASRGNRIVVVDDAINTWQEKKPLEIIQMQNLYVKLQEKGYQVVEDSNTDYYLYVDFFYGSNGQRGAMNDSIASIRIIDLQGRTLLNRNSNHHSLLFRGARRFRRNSRRMMEVIPTFEELQRLQLEQ